LVIGFGLSVHLTAIWATGESIGHRPLLILSVLLMVIGMQVLATGLIAELVVHMARHDRPYVIGRVLASRTENAADAEQAMPALGDQPSTTSYQPD